MRVRQCRLISKGGLRPLKESATVCHTSEDTRNELRIIHKAEPEECRVLLAKIEVQAGVEGVAILSQNRRISEILEEARAVWLRVQVEQLDGIWIQPVGWNDVEATGGERKSRGTSSARTEWITHKAARNC